MFYARKLYVAAIVLTAFFFSGGTAFAAFDPESYAVDDGVFYTLDAQGEWTKVEGARVGEEDIQGKKIYWYAVSPDTHEMHKDWIGGIYFFGDNGKFISMVKKEDAERSYVQFSPDGEQFILNSGTYVNREYLLYEFDGLKLKKSFHGIGLAWLDPVRFVFTLIDTSKDERYEGAANSGTLFEGWLSVVVYDSAADSLTTVVEATKTEDFMMNEFDGNTGELVITKISVTDEKDWAEENLKHEEIRVRVP